MYEEEFWRMAQVVLLLGMGLFIFGWITWYCFGPATFWYVPQ